MRALRGVFVLILALALPENVWGAGPLPLCDIKVPVHQRHRQLPANVWGADFQAGVEAAKRGDLATALKEWRPLAEEGHAEAQRHLGIMYYSGSGVTQDYAEAEKWYRLSAEQGNAEAQLKFCWMYNWGFGGVTPDEVQALMWCNLAVAHFPPGERRDMAVSNRESVKNFMSPAQIAEAERLAREWKPK